jgi:hypothetical protein
MFCTKTDPRPRWVLISYTTYPGDKGHGVDEVIELHAYTTERPPQSFADTQPGSCTGLRFEKMSPNHKLNGPVSVG